MTKEIKSFITRDDFASNSGTPSPIYDLSPIALTYSKSKKSYYPTSDPRYSLHVFNQIQGTGLTQDEVNEIVKVITSFSDYVTSTSATSKAQILALFLNQYNTVVNPYPVSDFNYNNIVSSNNLRAGDYLTFKVKDVICSVWASDALFKAFYPDYTIEVVYPFNNFTGIMNSASDFVSALDSFDFVEFNKRVDQAKNAFPETVIRVLNIPYKVPSTSVMKNCYFGFIVYGGQGNFDYLLKLALYQKLSEYATANHLTITLESLFPSILNINEFFIVPRWDKTAISSQVGLSGIASQISSTYSEPYDITKHITIYTGDDFFKANTYNVPVDYNNILLQVVNGMYSEANYRDFKAYYPDLLTVSSSHPDFSRMKTRTQRFVTLLETLLRVSDVNTSTELFNNVMAVTNYPLSILNRAGVIYVSVHYEDHQYYIVPKFQLLANLAGN